MSSPITTHVLDTSIGRPAAGVDVKLERALTDEAGGAQWQAVGSGVTNSDGRVTDLLAAGSLEPGVYQIHFEIGEYFKSGNREAFYPSATIVFNVTQLDEHYHVPLLLNPFGYSTYRGS